MLKQNRNLIAHKPHELSASLPALKQNLERKPYTIHVCERRHSVETERNTCGNTGQ